MWKKMSIFWELPYWKILEVHSAIDVMHVTKNVSAHVPSSGSYIRGRVEKFTVYQFLASAAATIVAHPAHL
jgi:hypothetical protein